MNKMFFICPMSKNVVDSILEIGSDKIGITVTRRQVDFNGGYVNNWNTDSFFNYIRNKNEYGEKVIIERDHGGPNQGLINDDGYVSLINDLNYFQLIHIDPWKISKSIEEGVNKTIEYIKILHLKNPNVKFEIGTEQNIFPYTSVDLEIFISQLISGLSESEYNSIEYIVTQSGESLDLENFKNKGQLNINQLKRMALIGKNFNKKIKEHNGDFLSSNNYDLRFNHGVNAINIGPELAVIETQKYLEYMTKSEINDFYQLCLSSKNWERWISGDVNDFTKKHIIEICGHYNYSKFNMPNIDSEIKEVLKKKINNLINIIQ